MSPFEVRSEQPGEEAAIARVNDAAFGQADESRIIGAIRRAGHPNLSLVAVDGSEVVARALRAGLDPAQRPDLGEAHRPQHLAYVVGPARAFRNIGGTALRAVAAVQPEASLAVPVDPTLRILGWRIHASQHLERAYPLPGWLLFDFRDKEHNVVLNKGSIRSGTRTELEQINIG